MKRNLIGILSLVVMSALISATGAYAQSYVKADVPFAFMVGSAQLPAGPYEIRSASSSATAIMILNHQTNAGAVSNARREYPRDTQPKLVFHHVGNQYFLAEIWKGSGSEGMIVPTSKQEKELEKELRAANGRSGGYEEVIVALN
jgi:hypothetical protein